MADFERNETDFWREEVPGARWFKADLQIHTIDDLPGCQVKVPEGVNPPCNASSDWSEDELRAYARIFLQNAVKKGVRVLGLTPHRPRMSDHGDMSAVWQIVQEWNEGDDDDGKPFREKIYAVFPGFEPSLHDGHGGLHMLFLFDPEIGRNAYLSAFDLVMKNRQPWKSNELQISSYRAKEAFKELREFHDRDNPWSYIALAPHIFSKKGLLKEQRAQVWDTFPHDELTGLGLNSKKLPEDVLEDHRFSNDHDLKKKYRDALFHCSDANLVEEIGNQYTWFKLASPRIEALRQAFLAGDSRIRIAYERSESGKLVEISDSPDETAREHSWLRSVTVKGKASFFGGDSGTRFDFHPDMTCIIGGSMTGKSAFLDGLRVHIGAPLPKVKPGNNPDDDQRNDMEKLKNQIKSRGYKRFLGSGSADVALEFKGGDPTAEHFDRWQAVFFSQNELQRLAQEPDAVEEVLARFAAAEATEIEARDERLRGMDDELRGVAKRIDGLDEEAADAEQSCERCRSAADALDAFSEAGIEEYHRASRDLGRWRDSAEASKYLAEAIHSALQSAEGIDMPDIDGALADLLLAAGVEEQAEAFRARWKSIAASIRDAMDELTNADAVIESIMDVLKTNEQNVRGDMNRKLAAKGMDSSKIDEFQALSRQATLLESYEAAFREIQETRRKEESLLEKLLEERKHLAEEQRRAFDRAIKAIAEKFEGQISARRIDEGDLLPLDRFVRNLNQRGVTRWWNDQKERPSSGKLIAAFENDDLASVGMSGAVQSTFRENLTRSKLRELKAIRCGDRYLLESKIEEDKYRPLDQLSGGKRVSLLLSLLLETDDNRPLVIDQPEDEIDNRFLFDAILPALKRLKGRRQIIIATHNANIVVNGDADQVIQLEATANHGWVEQDGAIEEPAVRNAIVQTVDGGGYAFHLRRVKYGF